MAALKITSSSTFRYCWFPCTSDCPVFCSLFPSALNHCSSLVSHTHILVSFCIHCYPFQQQMFNKPGVKICVSRRNVGVERPWKEVNEHPTFTVSGELSDLEANHGLDVTNPIHLTSLWCVYGPIFQVRCILFKRSVVFQIQAFCRVGVFLSNIPLSFLPFLCYFIRSVSTISETCTIITALGPRRVLVARLAG